MAVLRSHVRKLKLAVDDVDLIQTGRNLVENAFNTASFPHLPGSRKIYIKKLSLGTVDANVSPIAVSELVSKIVREAMRKATCVDERERTDADVVWFSDELAPYFLLIKKLLLGQSVAAWYWKSAVPEYSNAFNTSEQMDELIKAVGERTGTQLFYARLFNYLHVQNCLESFLNQLTEDRTIIYLKIDRTQYERYMHHLTRCEKQEESNQKETIIDNLKDAYSSLAIREKHISLPNSGVSNTIHAVLAQRMLREKILQWGLSDPRSFFLSYNLVLFSNPCLSMNLESTELVSDLLFAVNELPGSREDMNIDREVTMKGELNNLPQSTQEQNAYNEFTNEIDLEEEQIKPQSKSNLKIYDTNDATDRVIEEVKNDTTLLKKMSFLESSEFGNSRFQSTNYAGIAYVLRLLDILSIEAFIEQNEYLAMVNFPGYLLKTIIKRYDINADSAVEQFLPDSELPASAKIVEFVIPQSWHKLIYSDVSLLKTQSEGVNAIFDGKGLCLAQWTGEQPVLVKELLKNYSFSEKYNHFPTLMLDGFVRNTLIGMLRFLRRYAGVSLRSIIKKKGEYCYTQTHCDFRFDAINIDIRLRRSGLDISPGWLPWSGKVITIIYDNEQDEIYV